MTKSKLLGYIFTPIFLILFLSTLAIFHPILVLTFKIFGYNAHKFVLELMNRLILLELRIAGTRFNIILPYELPSDRPLIIISNHQSMYDIPLLILSFRKYHPKFIAKTELAYGLPSISFALRSMGSAIINRKDAKQAISAIENFATKTKELNHTACIFPEGTRAKDGKLKKFKTAGVSALVRNIPNAFIVPVAIAGNWEILKYKFLPVPYGVKVTLKMLQPFEIEGLEGKAVCEKAEVLIRKELTVLQP